MAQPPDDCKSRSPCSKRHATSSKRPTRSMAEHLVSIRWKRACRSWGQRKKLLKSYDSREARPSRSRGASARARATSSCRASLRQLLREMRAALAGSSGVTAVRSAAAPSQSMASWKGLSSSAMHACACASDLGASGSPCTNQSMYMQEPPTTMGNLPRACTSLMMRKASCVQSPAVHPSLGSSQSMRCVGHCSCSAFDGLFEPMSSRL
mmetsp:Transcript_72371/g.182576  ORF Transcript_72371/g.182576 Transcript_72371/m.182576 type:complete len:209 (+) Transcript_72371:1536-2162(+)